MRALVVYESLFGAPFDTRLARLWIPGSAARTGRRQLRRPGCRTVAAPETHRVAGTAGLILDGEPERAARRAAGVAALLSEQQHRV